MIKPDRWIRRWAEEGGVDPYAPEQVNAASYDVRDHQASFTLGAYDRSKQLIIDPILVYSTFLGGTGVEFRVQFRVSHLGWHE